MSDNEGSSSPPADVKSDRAGSEDLDTAPTRKRVSLEVSCFTRFAARFGSGADLVRLDRLILMVCSLSPCTVFADAAPLCRRRRGELLELIWSKVNC